MSSALPPIENRDVLFVSHANPEDNAFATWLTLRLTREGYRVWCDVVKLRGGDDFWKNIETAIRNHTRRLLFVTSRASNVKQGPLQELAVASSVARQLNDGGFIIPLKVDDLPHSDHNIQINRLNALSFNHEWAEGLAVLLKTLEDASVPRPEAVGPASIASWWNANKLNHNILKRSPESLWSNWFPIHGLPKRLWVWPIPDDSNVPTSFPYPTHRLGKRLFSFANSEALTGKTTTPTGSDGYSFGLNLKRDPPQRTGLLRHEVVSAVKQLIREAWLRMTIQRGLPLFELSSRKRTLWFPHGLSPDNPVTFIGVDSKKCRRDLYGYRTLSKLSGEKYQRFWHFGLESVPLLYPSPVLALKTHVVFTLDGKHVTGDAKAQHRARRSQCKDWWNDKWRDLTLAAVTWLTSGTPRLALPLSPESNLYMEWRPIKYRSQWSYDDAAVRFTPIEETRESSGPDDDSEEEVEIAEAHSLPH